MDIFLYICNMEDVEVTQNWIEIYYYKYVMSYIGYSDFLSAYHKVESVKRLWEIGVHTTFNNRNKIIC